jgi:hypothetical protein
VTKNCSLRQAALQAEAAQVLAELDLGRRFGDVGPVLVVGSYVSGLMCWRDLDVCLLAGVDYAPSDVLELLKRVVELPGVVGLTYRDERGERCPTGQARDERYHVPFDLDIGQGRWRIDLSVWLARPARSRGRLASAAARHHHRRAAASRAPDQGCVAPAPELPR